MYGGLDSASPPHESSLQGTQVLSQSDNRGTSTLLSFSGGSSRDTTPCRITRVTSHGVVSPDFLSLSFHLSHSRSLSLSLALALSLSISIRGAHLRTDGNDTALSLSLSRALSLSLTHSFTLSLSLSLSRSLSLLASGGAQPRTRGNKPRGDAAWIDR